MTLYQGAPVAQWVKRWPTDLAVPSWIPARGKIFSTVNGVPLHTSFHYHLPVVLIWLKYCWKGRSTYSMGFGCPHPGMGERWNQKKLASQISLQWRGMSHLRCCYWHLLYHVTNGIEVMYHFFVLFVQFIRYYIYVHFTFKRKKIKDDIIWQVYFLEYSCGVWVHIHLFLPCFQREKYWWLFVCLPWRWSLLKMGSSLMGRICFSGSPLKWPHFIWEATMIMTELLPL